MKHSSSLSFRHNNLLKKFINEHFTKLEHVSRFLLVFRLLACGVLTLTISGGSHGKLTGDNTVCMPSKGNPKSHRHVISPYNFNTLSTKIVMRVNQIISS